VADVQRYVKWSKNTIITPVQSGVTVEIGDLMFLDKEDDLRNDGSSTANNCAYPLEYLRISGASLELNKRQVKNYFLGVALNSKEGIGDITEITNISIATAGVFNFDMKPAKTVYIGEYVAPSGTTSGSDMYNQKVMKSTEVLDAIGFFAERKSYARTADVVLKTTFGRLGSIT